ncbi:TPA: hypothetical protein QDC55_002471, partial [Burkholderia cenocepacia]|nr:hypothetical protein [Burkholderia cenocepacia]
GPPATPRFALAAVASQSMRRPFHLKAVSGVGVLCNTSLNFNGAGFINRTSDLARYAMEAGLDGFVARDKLYMKCNPE